jgi:hypothetical protein
VGSAWDWQPCTTTSCAVFGTPRRQVKAKVTDTRYSRRWLEMTIAMKATTGRGISQGLSEMPVVLQRRTGGKWKKVYANLAYVDVGGYVTNLKRPAAGTCRVKVFFPGDHEFEPLTTTTGTMRC